MPGETALWMSLRSFGRAYKANGCASKNRKSLRSLLQLAANQHWSVADIAEASTLSRTTVRKYITK